MKTKISILILVAVFLINSSWAQPIITGVVIGPQGSKTMAYVIPGTIIPGTTGANQIWDYANIVHDPTSYYLKNVSFGGLSKSIRDAFPTGNLANEYVLNGTLVATLVFRIEATDLLYLGMNTIVFPVPDIQLVFPHSYQKTLAGFTYDAYGTLKTPFGTYNKVVRLRETNGSKHKYDYWQFDPYYILLMENALDSVNVKHLSPGFFYPNFLSNIGMIKHAGIIGGNYGENAKLVLVHPEDIAEVAAEELQGLSFKGKSVRYIASDEKSTHELAAIIGKAIRKPELPWVNFKDEDTLAGMLQAGLPEDVAKNYAEMGSAMRSREMASDYNVNRPAIFGKTKLEEFAHVFAAVYAQS